jgi:hypothetical protein
MSGAGNGADLRVVPLYDGMDPVTGPYFGPDHERIADPAERERVAGYMRDGLVVLRTTSLEPDAVEPSRGSVVPGSFRTDGSWVWSDALMYYAREHGIAPDREFYAHVVASGYRCPQPPTSIVRKALQVLMPHGNR